MNKTKNILKIVVEIILLIVIVFIGITTFEVKKTNSNPDNKGLFNIKPIIVESDSMQPTIKKNDLVFIKYSNSRADYSKDMIAVYVTKFYSQYYTVVHRIKSINKDGSITFRGDANIVNDNPISFKAVKGYVIFTLPGLGAFINILVKNNFVYWLIVIIYLVLVVYMNLDYLKKKIKRNKDVIKIVEKKVTEVKIEENKEVQISKDVKPKVEEIKIEKTNESTLVKEVKEEYSLEKEVEAILNGEKPKVTKKLSELDINSLQEFIFNKPKDKDISKKKLLRKRDSKDNDNIESK